MVKKFSRKVFQLDKEERERLAKLKNHLGLKSEADTVRLALKKTAQTEGLQ